MNHEHKTLHLVNILSLFQLPSLSWDCSLADYDDCPHSKAASKNSNKIVFNIPPRH